MVPVPVISQVILKFTRAAIELWTEASRITDMTTRVLIFIFQEKVSGSFKGLLLNARRPIKKDVPTELSL